jgi:hypothetical protein
MIKTFRGQLADDGQDKIRLSTKQGKIGYRIVKFQLMGRQPAGSDQESIVKVHKRKQTATLTSIVDFSDSSLLAVGYLETAADAKTEYQPQIIVFDIEVFNQDIYISHVDNESGSKVNYYLELETIALSDNATLVATLSNVRLNPQVGA